MSKNLTVSQKLEKAIINDELMDYISCFGNELNKDQLISIIREYAYTTYKVFGTKINKIVNETLLTYLKENTTIFDE